MTTQKKDWKIMLNELEDKLAEFFTKKVPALPENIREGIVKYGPYLALIGIVFSLSALLPLLGIGAVVAPLAVLTGVRGGIGYIFPLIFGLVIIVLEAMAIKGLFKRQMKAWKLMFYISLISAVSSLSTLDLPGLIVGLGLSWYILFQIRSYYK
jgi:hypothetical protein